MRKLASIQKVLSVSPIEGADKVVKCTILGWDVVCKKGEFTEGQIGVYCEVDSVMPEKPEFEFLRERRFRIKTIKLRGQVSQGIFFPMSILPKGKYTEGDDVTDIIGVTKFESKTDKSERERELVKSGRMKKFMMRYSWFRRLFSTQAKADFPKFIRKTDEDRIQLFPGICQQWGNTVFEATEKVDGQSATYFIIPNPSKWQFWNKWVFGVCSRNFHLIKEDNSTWWRIAGYLSIKSKMIEVSARFKDGFYIQGEILGEGVQSNKYGIKGLRFLVFNVVNLSNGDRYDSTDMEWICGLLGLETVPILDCGYELETTIPECVKTAVGTSVLSDIPREGLVIRNYEENISFKIINPEFLLKYDQ